MFDPNGILSVTDEYFARVYTKKNTTNSILKRNVERLIDIN